MMVVIRASNVPERSKEGPWGPWCFDGKYLEHDDTGYYIDIKRCGTSAAILDWITQISHKAWGTQECVGWLVRAFDAVIDLQANRCGNGREQT